MCDNGLIRALEREGDLLDARGQAGSAREAHHLASALRASLMHYRVAVADAVRWAECSPSDLAARLALREARAAIRERSVLVRNARQHGERFLSSCSTGLGPLSFPGPDAYQAVGTRLW